MVDNSCITMNGNACVVFILPVSSLSFCCLGRELCASKLLSPIPTRNVCIFFICSASSLPLNFFHLPIGVKINNINMLISQIYINADKKYIYKRLWIFNTAQRKVGGGIVGQQWQCSWMAGQFSFGSPKLVSERHIRLPKENCTVIHHYSQEIVVALTHCCQIPELQ